MSISSNISSTNAAATAAEARAMSRSGAAKPLFPQMFGVVEAAQQRLAAKLDTNGDGGIDRHELQALGGLGGGKNGPAGFAALDGDGDGRLNRYEREAAEVLSLKSLNSLLADSGGLAGWLIEEGDVDLDGALTLEEFRAVGPTGEWGSRNPDDGAPQLSLNKAERAFAAADVDGDGKVTARELAGVMTGHLRRLPAANAMVVAGDLLKRDADASGGLSRSELAGGAKLDSIFDLVDRDADGEITLAELQAEVSQNGAYYSNGVRFVGPALKPLDPAAPDYLQQVRERLSSIGEFQPTPPGQEALFKLLRENFARLTEQMVAEVARPPVVT